MAEEVRAGRLEREELIEQAQVSQTEREELRAELERLAGRLSDIEAESLLQRLFGRRRNR